MTTRIPRFWSCSAGLAAVVLTLVLSSPAQAQLYCVSTVPSLGGGETQGFDINNQGDVAGTFTSNGMAYAGVYMNNSITTIPLDPAYWDATGHTDINNSSISCPVVVDSIYLQPDIQGYKWSACPIPPADPLQFEYARPLAINDLGAYVGSLQDLNGSGPWHSIPLSFSSSMTELPTLVEDGIHGEAFDINNSNTIVGYVFRPSDNYYPPPTVVESGRTVACTWHREDDEWVVTPLKIPCDLNANVDSRALLINDSGQIVAWDGYQDHPVFIEDGFAYPIATSVYPGVDSINNDGYVVGRDANGAFIWEPGCETSISLTNANLTPSDGWYYHMATGINDLGQILCQGRSLNQPWETRILTPQYDPPHILSMVSRKTHGTAGDFDIALPRNQSGIESRAGQVTRIVVEFDRIMKTVDDVFADPWEEVEVIMTGAVTVAGLALNTNASNHSELTIDLNNVAAVDCLRLRIKSSTSAGLVDNSTGHPFLCGNMLVVGRVLPGDVNADGGVTLSDVFAVEAHIGQTVSQSNCQFDFDADGDIDSNDVAAVRANLGNFGLSCVSNDCRRPVAILSAVSQKTHGTAGDFPVNLLPGTGAVAVEGRNGGPTTIIVAFSEDIQAVGTLDPADVALTSTGGSPGTISQLSIVDEVLTIEMSGAPDQSRLRIAFPGITSLDGRPITDTLCMGCLVGDVNGSGTVNNFDIVAVQGSLGQTLDYTNFTRDPNCSGSINNFDVLLVRGRLGNSIPGSCPP